MNELDLNRALGHLLVEETPTSEVKTALSRLRDLRRQQEEATMALREAAQRFLQQTAAAIRAVAPGLKVIVGEEAVTISSPAGANLTLIPRFGSQVWEFGGAYGQDFEERHAQLSLEQDLRALAQDVADYLTHLST